MGRLCYIENAHPIKGSFTINFLVYMMPEFERHLFKAWRTQHSWQKLHIAKEGGPVGL